MTKKSKKISENVKLREIPGTNYSEDEIGVVHTKSPQDIIEALSLAKEGQIYDLDSGRWAGMPMLPSHPPFILTSYRSPRGFRNQHDFDDWFGRNSPNMGINTELMVGTAHTGTHLDALSHITCGDDSHWYGGYPEEDFLGDFGPLTAEASSIAPFVCRGILIDIAAHKGVDILPAADQIKLEDAKGALERQGTLVREGDAVLFRTGYMQVWGRDDKRTTEHAGAGINHDVAEWLAETGVVLVGADTEALERIPSADPENPHPVHIELLIKRGIHILELVHVEDLAADNVYEFLFICLPLRIKGATGSMVRPIAII